MTRRSRACAATRSGRDVNAANEARVAAVTAKLTGGIDAGYFQPARRTWWRRVLWHLFPCQYIEAPDHGHYMRTRVETQFDWKDRLRILISGRVTTETVTETENMAGFCRSRSVQYVRAPGDLV